MNCPSSGTAYRTKETHRRAVVGSGLGLNIVRTIFKRHGDSCGAASEEGSGTATWFELPWQRVP